MLNELEHPPSVEFIEEIIYLEDTEHTFNELTKHNTGQDKADTYTQQLNARLEEIVRDIFEI